MIQPKTEGGRWLQGMMVAEVVMDHLARAVGKSSAAMRELNLYKEGDTTHFGQTLDGCQVCPIPERPASALARGSSC